MARSWTWETDTADWGVTLDEATVADYPNLVAALQARGYSDEDLGKILGGNLLRVWSTVEAGSEQHKH